MKVSVMLRVDLAGRCVNRLPLLQTSRNKLHRHSTSPPDAAVSAFSRAVLRAVSQAVTGRSRTHRLRYDVTSGKCESEENSARTPNRVELSYAGQRPSFLASSTSGMHARVAAVRRFLGEAPVWWNSRSAATGDAAWSPPRPKPARELTP